MFDLIIQNAALVDGTGSPAFRGDLAVRGGKIAAIGTHLGPARQVVDAGGLTLAPGFIDSHSHGDMMAELDNTFFQLLEQGVTTQIAGMCGFSAAPFSPAHLDDAMDISAMVSPYDFRPTASQRYRYADYLDRIDRPTGTNMAVFVGHGTLRCAVMGLADREPTPQELEEMSAILSQALEDGATGLSFGLAYPVGSYARTPELIALARVVAEHGGVVSVHVRDEGNGLIPSNEEMLQVVRGSGCKLVISHHKAINEPNWGKTTRTLAMIEQANAEGFNVYCDQYPYSASSTGLKSRIPQHMHALGEGRLMEMLSSPEERPGLREKMLLGQTGQQRFGNTMFGASPAHPEYTGRMVLDVARELGQDPCYLVMDVLRDDHLATNGIYFCINDEDLERVMRFNRTMIGTDGIYYKGCSGAHPRAFGTFPRVLGRYVRQLGVLTLEDAVRKMTSLPASVYGLEGKGLLRVGMDADLVLFDPKTICDRADFTQFDLRCDGICQVWIAGQSVVEGGAYNGALQGRLLRHRRKIVEEVST